MKFWNKIQEKAVLNRLEEESLYEVALQEFENGPLRRGLWAQAMVEAQGDANRTKAAYLKLLAIAIKDEVFIANKINDIKSEINQLDQKITSQEKNECFDENLCNPLDNSELKPATPKKLSSQNPKLNKLLSLCHRLRIDGLAFDQYQTLADAVGASLSQESIFSSSYVIKKDQEIIKFKNLPLLKPWFIENVLPKIESQANGKNIINNESKKWYLQKLSDS